MLASSCTEVKQEGQGYEPIIGKQEITIKDGRLTPEALWAMGRIGSLSISPDGKQIAYTVAYYSVPENKSHHVIYVMDADGKNNKYHDRTNSEKTERIEDGKMVRTGARRIHNALRILHHGHDGSATGLTTNPRRRRRTGMDSQ